jgi:hypothetical protein
MATNKISVGGAIGIFFAGMIAGTFVAVVARYLYLKHGLKKKTHLQKGEDFLREGQRRWAVQVVKGVIHQNERIFGQGEDAKQWIIQKISEVPTVLHGISVDIDVKPQEGDLVPTVS